MARLLVTMSVAALSAALAACSSATDVRASGICPPVKASQIVLGQSTPKGLSGNSYTVGASLHVGEYIWVNLDIPLSANSYPATASKVLRRVCTQATPSGSRSLFVARNTGIAAVLSEPRPSRAAMLAFRAQITVLPSGGAATQPS